MNNLPPFYRLRPTARESAMVDFALSRFHAKAALERAKTSRILGYDASMAVSHARKHAEEARIAWITLKNINVRETLARAAR